MPIPPLRFIDDAKRWLGTSRWLAARPLALLIDEVVERERQKIVQWLNAGPPFADRHALAGAIERGEYLKPADLKWPKRVPADVAHILERRDPGGHVVFVCTHCGTERLIVLPQPVDNVHDIFNVFEAKHRTCPKPRKRKR